MYVCNCAGVTHRELHRHLDQGATNVKALCAERGLCRGCGKCAREVGEVLKGYRSAAALPGEVCAAVPGSTLGNYEA
ncbi:MAG: bacterioferritin-associated ferredoxin [Candidatus Tectimicrobiota bacterium]